MADVKRDRGVTLIIAYKIGKGVLWLAFAVTIAVMQQLGLGGRMVAFAEELQHHAHAWSVGLAQLLMKASSHRALWTICVALVADGLVGFVEAWALIHGHWWGPWLVVVATSVLLP